MAFFDVAILSIIITIVGWGIKRIEYLRSSQQSVSFQVVEIANQQEILKADLMSKLDIIIFRLRAIEARFEDSTIDE